MVRLSKTAREIEKDERESRGSTYRVSYGELFKDSKKKLENGVMNGCVRTRSRSRSQDRSDANLSIVVGNLPTELAESDLRKFFQGINIKVSESVNSDVIINIRMSNLATSIERLKVQPSTRINRAF